MRVLIVEDDPLIAMHLAEMVAELGHNPCATASTVAQAVGQAETCHPDVALMDIRLAHGDNGLDAARLLRQLQALRCIFVSSTFDDRTLRSLGSLDPIDCVQKPVLPVRLREALERAQDVLAEQ